MNTKTVSGRGERLLFDSFQQLLTQANRKVNLISHSEEAHIEANIQDSLLLSPLLPTRGRVLDLGSGGGFPVIPLAILHRELSFTAVEKSQRKCDFLEHVSHRLKLPHLQVIHGRIETQTELHHQCEAVTARALAPLSKLVLLGAPFLTPTGKLLFLKGKNFESELNEAASQLEEKKLSLDEVQITEDLPGREFTATVVISSSGVCSS
ncbi:16S rRNA (guanine(527)-N(7))-methyltransferase RsmG [bacterium]|nr:16S rRNA (guanine(527)-N(7))-methyltransferase RsmG [bacterium]